MPMNVRVVVGTAQRPFFLVLLAIPDKSQRFDRTASRGDPYCLFLSTSRLQPCSHKAHFEHQDNGPSPDLWQNHAGECE